jgi:drug/metabolite transporter (DMT)-like permease
MRWVGEVFGVLTGLVWTYHSRLGREMGKDFTGAEITAHCMLKSSVWLIPFVIWNLFKDPIDYNQSVIVAQVYNVLFGSVIAYIFWYTGLRYWAASRVLLFNNLIAPCTMAWAYFCFGEHVSPTFWIAMFLIGAGILILQWNQVKSLVKSEEPSK